jgi:putative transposase
MDMKPFHGRADHRGPREQQAGAKTSDVCRKHGISSATFYKWKAKYGGLEVSEARRLKALEDENLLAEAELDKAMLKEITSNAARELAESTKQAASDQDSIEITRLISSLLKPTAAVFLRPGSTATS